jgi:hypothetical protein
VLVRGIRSETRTDGMVRICRLGTDDCTGTDCRWRLDLKARWVDNRSWINSGHPNSNLVLLEQVGDEIVEVHICLREVEVRQLVMVAEHVSDDDIVKKRGHTLDTLRRGSPSAICAQRPFELQDASPSPRLPPFLAAWRSRVLERDA